MRGRPLVAARLVAGLVRRVWVFGVIGLMATAGLVVKTAHEPGLYWGSADVVLLTPPSAKAPNTIGLVSGSLIATAGLIQRQVSGGPAASHVVSDDVTLLDEGVTSGVTVTLPNAGGQWANNFEKAVLHVQSVDPVESVALSRLRAMVASVQSALAARETEAHVQSEHRIGTDVTPSTLTVRHFTGKTGRSIAASGLVGLSATAAFMVFVDRRRHGLLSSSGTVKAGPHRTQPRST